MTDCSSALLENAPLDPKKLPNYVFGMVLGPSDFRQVLENFNWKHRNSNALLHGSGTVCGLKVWLQVLPGAADVEIGVSAGFAISPRGRWIRIERDQCAPLNQWLQGQKDNAYASAGPGPQKLYVTLCYNQCLTDLVPIAGQQCGTDASNQAPSRILESFALQFSWIPPAQPVEERVRLFGALLRRVEVVDTEASLPDPDDSEALFDALRALSQDPLPIPGSLPDCGPFRIASDHADDIMRAALIIWVTEVCPAFRPKSEISPLLASGTDDCLLLAAIEFTVAANGQLSIAVDSLGQLVPGMIVIDETQRPVLVPTRLMQEFMGDSAAERRQRSDTLTFTPSGGAWAQFATLALQLPADLPLDSSIELAIEDSTPALLGLNPGNVALTLHRPAGGSLPAPMVVAATSLSAAPALTSLTVRWRAAWG